MSFAQATRTSSSLTSVAPPGRMTTALVGVRDEPPRPRPSREQLEKANILARKEGHVRYDPIAVEKPLRTDASAGAIYQSDAQRFQTDVAGEERARRQQSAAKEQARLAQRRDGALARDEKRWASMAAESAAAEAKIARKRSSGLSSKKNAPCSVTWLVNYPTC